MTRKVPEFGGRRKIRRIPRIQQPTVLRINGNYASVTREDPASRVARPRTNTREKLLDLHAPKSTESLVLPETKAVRCAVVGNAASILTKQEGEFIESFDMIVRINSVRIREAACQGKRTNVLFVHAGTLESVPRRVYKMVDVININTDIPDLYSYWANRIKEEIDENARVTTGFMAIISMMQLKHHITLFGFDWYETPTYYTNRGPWKKHHPQWEKTLITSMLETHNASLCNNTEEPQVLEPSS